MNMKELLWEIRQRIAKPGGWVKYQWHDDSGASCLLGHCENVVGMRDRKPKSLFAKVAQALGYVSWADVVAFNDSPGTTKEDVLQRLDEGMHNCKDLSEVAGTPDKA